MKKHAWLVVVIAALVAHSGVAFAADMVGKPVKGPTSVGRTTSELSAVQLSSAAVPLTHQLTCSAANFSVGTASNGKASVTCYNVQEATNTEYDSTMPDDATNYLQDKEGTKDQWEVTTMSGRSGSTVSYSDYKCPTVFSVKRQAGPDLCTKTNEVTPALVVKK